MLDLKTAITLKKAIDRHTVAEHFTLEDVCNMQPIPHSASSDSYTVLALQCGDLTLLVWVQFNEKDGVVVRKVRTFGW